MAIGQAYAAVSAAAFTKPRVWRSAWWKATWGAAWQYVPYLDPQWAEETCAPDVGSARFRYDYGLILRELQTTATLWYPISLSGGYIAIRVEDAYGAATLWVGVVDKETHMPHGIAGRFQGPEYFDAFSLEHLVDRVQVEGTYTEFGYIDRAVHFNKAPGHGMVLRGNRSASVASNGAYTFGDGGAKWTSLQIVGYLLANYGPAGLTFQIVGDYGILNYITEEWSFEGKSVFAALNELIDKNRGLSWRLISSGSGTIYLYVFSTLAYPISTGATTMPANANQVIINFDGLVDVQPEISINRMTTYDALVVKGGPIYTCFSVGFADGTLEEGWTAAQETAYNTGSTAGGATAADDDAERNTEKLANVFQCFRVPYTWNGYAGNGVGGTKYNAGPGYDRNAYVNVNNTTNLWYNGKTFERELPILAPTATNSQPEFLRSFAVAQDPTTSQYHFVEKFKTANIEPSHVRLSDTGLAVHVVSAVGHIQALNTFDDVTYPTDRAPEWDYNTLVVTVNFKTDANPSVYVNLTSGTQTGRTKILEYPQAEVWLILPGTVVDVQNGALVHASGWTTVRDDTASLRAIAAMAAAAYLVPHAQLGFVMQGVSIALATGCMVKGVGKDWTLTDVNAPITSRRWDFTGDVPTTSWQANWSEFDPTFAATVSQRRNAKTASRSRARNNGTGQQATYRHASPAPKGPALPDYAAGMDAKLRKAMFGQ